MLYTFNLIDGRKVTYAGETEKHAFNKARAYHRDAVSPMAWGKAAEPCPCSPKHANNTRQDGWLICRDCAGYMG